MVSAVRNEFTQPNARSTRPNGHSHFVQLYDDDNVLIDSLSNYLTDGLNDGAACLVVITQEHRARLEDSLAARGADVAALSRSGQYLALDARATLDRIVAGEHIDPQKFRDVIGTLVSNELGNWGQLRVFGEMVGLLGSDGLFDSAVQLEHFWEELHRDFDFGLYCAYPSNVFADGALGAALKAICTQHDYVVPAESYDPHAPLEQQLRSIVLLQQRANSFQSEQERRREAAESFLSLAESVPQKIFTVSQQGEVEYANCRWVEFTGIQVGEGAKVMWYSVLHPDDVDSAHSAWDVARGQEQAIRLEHRIKRGRGSFRWHVTNLTPLTAANGRVVRWIGSSADIHEQKQREQQLDRSIRLRDEFLSSVSHDLKTPLTVLQGRTQVLKRKLEQGRIDTQAAVEGLQQIEAQSRHITRLVDELLDVTQMRSGEALPLDCRRVDLVDLVKLCVSQQQETTRIHRITLTTNCRAVYGEWDDVRFSRVIQNLLSNAVKYSPDGGIIEVTLRRDEDGGRAYAVLTVEDPGIGIPPADLPHVFDWFYRGKNAGPGIRGTGIGLPGSKQIVEQHGGSIAASSKEGVGTRVTVRLPLP